MVNAGGSSSHFDAILKFIAQASSSVRLLLKLIDVELEVLCGLCLIHFNHFPDFLRIGRCAIVLQV